MSAAILRPAEWVLPGHPDKLADAVADTLVQAAQRLQREALCSIEVAVHRNAAYLTGRIACEGSGQLDLQALVHGVYASAGYGGHWRPAPEDITVGGNICLDQLVPGEEVIRHVSDDQSIVTGYAVDLPGVGYIPPEQWLAREIARRLFEWVHSPIGLCPDGKVLVVMEEGEGEGKAQRSLRAVSCSLLAQAGDIELQRAVVKVVGDVMQEAVSRIPGFVTTMPEDITVNGSGTFVMGGPEGDNGLSGKKLLLDHYGPRVPIGGTALSGKDFWKPDRAGTLLARRLALAVVRAGVAHEASVQFVTFPGDEMPRIVRISTPSGEVENARRWLDLVNCGFSVAADWGSEMDLVDGARWGWFGRGAPWEALALR